MNISMKIFILKRIPLCVVQAIIGWLDNPWLRSRLNLTWVFLGVADVDVKIRNLSGRGHGHLKEGKNLHPTWFKFPKHSLVLATPSITTITEQTYCLRRMLRKAGGLSKQGTAMTMAAPCSKSVNSLSKWEGAAWPWPGLSLLQARTAKP